MTAKNKYLFISAVAGLFLVPFLILSRHFVYGEGELRKKDTLRYMELRTSAGAGIVSDVLNLDYSLSRAVQSASGDGAVKAALSRRVRENPFICSELALLSPSGRELARYSAESAVKTRLDYSSTQAFEGARRTLGPAGAVEYGEYTPPALVIAEPLMRGGKPAYFLAGRLSLAYVGEVVRLMGRNSYGNFGLVDPGGQIIADSMSLSIVKPGLKAPPEVIKMVQLAMEREVPSFSAEAFLKGRGRLVSVSNVNGSRWWVYEIVNPADAPARRPQTWAWRVVASGVALVLVFAVFSYLLAVRLLKDVEQGPQA